ncbi:MAG: hypothetical protein IKM73_00705 [Acidaminococcaceae bacterium]|nr:hypothetical protein [Acidaminococcaceae bacterium]
MKNLETLKAEALEMLVNDDDLFCSMIDELDSWNGYADGFRCYPMDEIDELFCDCKVSEFLDKLAAGFCHNDEYFVDSIYGIDSTSDRASLYRSNVSEESLLDDIIEKYNHLYFYDSDFEELISDIVNYTDDDDDDADAA